MHRWKIGDRVIRNPEGWYQRYGIKGYGFGRYSIVKYNIEKWVIKTWVFEKSVGEGYGVSHFLRACILDRLWGEYLCQTQSVYSAASYAGNDWNTLLECSCDVSRIYVTSINVERENYKKERYRRKRQYYWYIRGVTLVYLTNSFSWWPLEPLASSTHFHKSRYTSILCQPICPPLL